MANEFIHKDIGSSLSEAEYDGVGAHIFNSQATGDILYASSGTQLSRLGIGATNKILTVIGGVPTWQSTLAGLTLTGPTLNGTVTLGSTPIFDAGAGSAVINTTGASTGLDITTTDAGAGGIRITTFHDSASPNTAAGGDGIYQLVTKGNDDGGNPTEYALPIEIYLVNVGDGTEEARFQMRLAVAGGLNVAMKVTGAGEVSGDLAYAVFDEQDDVELMVRDALPQLCDIGVVERKDTGSGYMLNFQKAIYLGWGGIRQNRTKIDDLEERLTRIEE